MSKPRYKVGDLLKYIPTDWLYLVEEIKDNKYYVAESQKGYISKWGIKQADRDVCVKKVN